MAQSDQMIKTNDTGLVIREPATRGRLEWMQFSHHNPWPFDFSHHLTMKIAGVRFLFPLALAAFGLSNASMPYETTKRADLVSFAETNVLAPVTSTIEKDLLKTMSKSSIGDHDGVTAIAIELPSYEGIDLGEKSLRRLPSNANDEREPNPLFLASKQATTSNDVPVNHGIRGTKEVSTNPADAINNRRVLFETSPDDEKYFYDQLLPLAGFLEDPDRTKTTINDFSSTYHEFSMPQTTPEGYYPLP
jgi:hypothetical protein